MNLCLYKPCYLGPRHSKKLGVRKGTWAKGTLFSGASNILAWTAYEHRTWDTRHFVTGFVRKVSEDSRMIRICLLFTFLSSESSPGRFSTEDRMSGHSWSFPNVCKGVTQSCLALGSLLLLECAQGTDKWLDPWLSSQCEQNGEGEEPGWFGSLMEAPSWKFLGALHTQHYKRRRNLPNHRKGLSREGLSPRPSPAGESCQPGGAQCQEAPCLLLLSCEVILGEATSPSGWCTEMCR